MFRHCVYRLDCSFTHHRLRNILFQRRTSRASDNTRCSHCTFSQYQEEERSQHHGRHHRTQNPKILYASFLGYIGSALGLQTPTDDDDEIKHKIRSSLVAISEKKYDEAESILHQSLQMAELKKNENAASYVLDLMANLYYQTEKYEEAIQLFTELMRRLVLKKVQKTNPAMIEISLKLADIYARTGDEDRAETGFRFCVENAKENLTSVERKYESFSFKFKFEKVFQDQIQGDGRFDDAYALYGMVLETYSQYLITRHRWDEAEEYVKQCLELSSFVYGPSKPHIVTLMNNFAALLLDDNKFEKACHLLAQATDRAILLTEMADQVPEMLCNYAEALWHLGQREKALEQAKLGVSLAEELKDEKIVNRTKKFLQQLLADKSPLAKNLKKEKT